MPASRVYDYVANKDGMSGGSIMVSPSKGKTTTKGYVAAGGQQAPMDFYYGPPVPNASDNEWESAQRAYNEAAGARYDIDALFQPTRTPNARAFDAGAKLSEELKNVIDGNLWTKDVNASPSGDPAMGKKETEFKDLFVLEHAVKIDSGRTNSQDDVWVYEQPGAKDIQHGGKFSKDGVDWARSTKKESQMTQKLLDILSYESGDKTFSRFSKASGVEVTDAHDKYMMGGFAAKDIKDDQGNQISVADQIKGHVEQRFEKLMDIMMNEFNGNLNLLIKGSFGMDARADSSYTFKGGKFVDPIYGSLLTETPHIIAKQFADRAKRIYAEQIEMGGQGGNGSYLYIVPIEHRGDLAVIEFMPTVELNEKGDLSLTSLGVDVEVVSTSDGGQGSIVGTTSRLVLQHMIRQQGISDSVVNEITTNIANLATLKKSIGGGRAEAIGSRVMVDYGTFFGSQFQPYMAMALILSSKEIADNLTAQINEYFNSPTMEKKIAKSIVGARDDAKELTHSWKKKAYPDDNAENYDQYGIWANEPFVGMKPKGEGLGFPFFIGTSQAVKAVEAATPKVGVKTGVADVKPAVRFLHDKYRQTGKFHWGTPKAFQRPVYGRNPMLEAVYRGKSWDDAPIKNKKSRGG